MRGKRPEDLRIISQSLWNKAQKMFEQIHNDSGHKHWGRYRSFVSDTHVSGILKCGCCGSNMILASGQKGGFYGCFEAKVKVPARISDSLNEHDRKKSSSIMLRNLFRTRLYLFQPGRDYNSMMNERLSTGRQNIQLYGRRIGAYRD